MSTKGSIILRNSDCEVYDYKDDFLEGTVTEDKYGLRYYLSKKWHKLRATEPLFIAQTNEDGDFYETSDYRLCLYACPFYAQWIEYTDTSKTEIKELNPASSASANRNGINRILSYGYKNLILNTSDVYLESGGSPYYLMAYNISGSKVKLPEMPNFNPKNIIMKRGLFPTTDGDNLVTDISVNGGLKPCYNYFHRDIALHTEEKNGANFFYDALVNIVANAGLNNVYMYWQMLTPKTTGDTGTTDAYFSYPRDVGNLCAIIFNCNTTSSDLLDMNPQGGLWLVWGYDYVGV